MKFLLSALIVASGFLLPVGTATAQETDCAIKYERAACTGQEAISFKKCDGNASCIKYKKAASLDECRAATTKSCANRRLNITKNKVITATYKGEAIQTASGKDVFAWNILNGMQNSITAKNRYPYILGADQTHTNIYAIRWLG